MDLIIGKNSFIVNQIQSRLVNFKFISHLEINAFDFNDYDRIFLFSWCHTSLKENIDLLTSLPLTKTVFVSSVAVYATAVRTQWSNYVNWKLYCEKLVLDGGGSLLRLGIFKRPEEMPTRVSYPCTSYEDLIYYLNSPVPSRISNIYSLEVGKKRIFFINFYKLLGVLSDNLPNIKYVQVLLVIFPKLLNYPLYSYTRDACKLFSPTARIGFGVLGCSDFDTISEKGDNIFVSQRSDRLLLTNGFKGTREGFKQTGLAKYWHGVNIVSKNGEFYKNVPIFCRRAKLPRSAFKIHIKSVKFSKNAEILADHDLISDMLLLADKVILAAGPLENCRLLLYKKNRTVTFSDHEIGSVGTVDLNEVLSKGYMSMCLGIISGRRIYVSSDRTYMIDFRPVSFSNCSDFGSIYNDTTSGILKKLILRCSFWQLNEAFFNKFGFGFRSLSINVFIQIVSRDCISLNTYSQNLIRTRISKNELIDRLRPFSQEWESFVPNISTLVDGIHIIGGKEVLYEPEVCEALKNLSLVILGSPTTCTLDFRHHTALLISSRKVG